MLHGGLGICLTYLNSCKYLRKKIISCIVIFTFINLSMFFSAKLGSDNLNKPQNELQNFNVNAPIYATVYSNDLRKYSRRRPTPKPRK